MSSKAHLDRLRVLRHQLDSVLDEELVAARINPASGETPGAWVPMVDILETTEAYEIIAELPGVLREDVELRIVDADLELLGTRRTPTASGSFHRMEGRYGAFHRIVPLGPDVDDNGITARLADGVLSVRVKKQGKIAGRREVSVSWGEEDA